MEGYENHFPDNNSLGFRFRISLARALAAGADIIILDEPFNKNIKPMTSFKRQKHQLIKENETNKQKHVGVKYHFMVLPHIQP